MDKVHLWEVVTMPQARRLFSFAIAGVVCLGTIGFVMGPVPVVVSWLLPSAINGLKRSWKRMKSLPTKKPGPIPTPPPEQIVH